MHPKILSRDACNMLLLGASPLLEVLPLLTAMSICLERPKQGQCHQRGQIGVKHQPVTEPPAGNQRHERSFTKGLISKYSSSSEIFLLSYCDKKYFVKNISLTLEDVLDFRNGVPEPPMVSILSHGY